MSAALYAVIPFAVATLMALFPFVAVGYRKLADRVFGTTERHPGPLPDDTFRQFTEPYDRTRDGELPAEYVRTQRERAMWQ